MDPATTSPASPTAVAAPAPQPAPRGVNDDPRYIEAARKLGEIQNRLTAVEQEIESAHSEIAERRRVSLVESQAYAIVYDQPLPSVEPPIDFKQLYRDQNMLALAVDMARARLEEVTAAVSREVVERARPAYVAAVRGVLEAARKLVEAVEAERKVIVGLERGGASVGALWRVTPRFDRERLERLVKEAREHHGIEI